LSDDAWRYVWEGRVLAAGLDPFLLAPDAPALAPLRDEAWHNVAHRNIPAIYPLGTQALALLAAPGGLFAWRVLSVAGDLATTRVLAVHAPTAFAPRAAALWALLPLPATESAISGHLEGLAIPLFLLGLGGSDAAAAIGATIKLLPALLLARARRDRRLLAVGAVVALAAWPSLQSAAFASYTRTWEFNPGLYAVFAAAFGPAARPVGWAIGGGIVAWAAWKIEDRGRFALWVCGALVALSPVVHPWYALWPLAAALWTGHRPWEVLAVTIPVSYVVLSTYDPATSTWTEPTWARAVVWAPFWIALVADVARRGTLVRAETPS
jgi:hypothetical protein